MSTIESSVELVGELRHHVNTGRLDAELDAIEDAIRERRSQIANAFRDQLRSGQRAKLTGNISPAYLRGLPVEIVGDYTGGRSYDLQVKPWPGYESLFRRYRGTFRVKRSMLLPDAA